MLHNPILHERCFLLNILIFQLYHTKVVKYQKLSTKKYRDYLFEMQKCIIKHSQI